MGRPLSFDTEKALNAAMRVFWEKGYEGASLDDLTSAMGIKRPSIYNCFGNKEQLFRLVLRRYERNNLGFLWSALKQKRLREVVDHLFQGILALVTREDAPKGALDINAAIACSAEGEAVRRLLIQRRAAYQRLISRRFVRARDEGELKSGASPDMLAHFVLLVGTGIALQAKADVPRAILEQASAIASHSILGSETTTACPCKSDHPRPNDDVCRHSACQYRY